MTPHPRGAGCFACEVKSWDAEGCFDLITVIYCAQCAEGEGNYNTHAALLSCPCADALPGASQWDGGGGMTPRKTALVYPPPPSPTPPPPCSSFLNPPESPGSSLCRNTQWWAGWLECAALQFSENKHLKAGHRIFVFLLWAGVSKSWKLQTTLQWPSLLSFFKSTFFLRFSFEISLTVPHHSPDLKPFYSCGVCSVWRAYRIMIQYWYFHE